MAKINITIDDELLSKLDMYADANYTSRSGFITQCVNEKIIYQESILTIGKIAEVLDKISKKTDINEDVQSEIDELISVSQQILRFMPK